LKASIINLIDLVDIAQQLPYFFHPVMKQTLLVLSVDKGKLLIRVRQIPRFCQIIDAQSLIEHVLE